jgi:cytochrome c oxidase subunit 4
MAEHILPKRTYYTIFGILLLCTYLTVQIAFLNLGALNTIAALAIAVFKAVLVILFFMHVKYSSRLTWVVVIGGFFWLAILLSLTMGDYLTRPKPGDGRLSHTRVAAEETHTEPLARDVHAGRLCPFGSRRIVC